MLSNAAGLIDTLRTSTRSMAQGMDSSLHKGKCAPTHNTSASWLSPWSNIARQLRTLRPQIIQGSRAALHQLSSTGRAWAGHTSGTNSMPTNHARSQPADGPKHVIFFANGLFGSPLNWDTIIEEIQKKTDTSQVLMHPSLANRRTDTFDGIDVCGTRLADEMRTVVSKYPSLERISVIGHSMGGLMLRYAVAQLFNPQANTIAGLAPAHFISLATPHLGCDGDGEAQVPLIGWAGPLTPVLQQLSVPTAAILFKRTGLQFFLEDPEAAAGKAKPLLVRMTEDDEERGLYFYSALKSFTSRTAYANTGQDHLVGWANSSLRFLHQLPRLPDQHATAKGVVLEDDIMAAFDTRFKPDQEPQQPKSNLDVPVEAPPAASRQVQAQRQPVAGQRAAGSGNARSVSTSAASTSLTGTSEMAATMLRRLQQLPWRRVDVCFQGSALSILSHNHIQVTRRWLNFEGRNVATHLAEQLVALENTLAELQQAAGLPAPGTADSRQLRRSSLEGLCKEAPAAAGGGSSTTGAAASPAAAAAAVAAAAATSGNAGSLSSWLAEQASHPHGRTTTLLPMDEDASEGGNGNVNGQPAAASQGLSVRPPGRDP